MNLIVHFLLGILVFKKFVDYLYILDINISFINCYVTNHPKHRSVKQKPVFIVTDSMGQEFEYECSEDEFSMTQYPKPQLGKLV